MGCGMSALRQYAENIPPSIPPSSHAPALRDAGASLAAFPRRSVGVFIASYLKLMRMGLRCR
jgi:hypothetical protein